MTNSEHIARGFTRKGLILIVALMPFHAFLSVWLGHVLGHQAAFQAWKEAVTVLLTAATAYALWRHPSGRATLRRPLPMAVAAFAGLALIVTALSRPGATAALTGAKIDLEFLLLFVIAYLAASDRLTRTLTKVVIRSSVVAATAAVILGTILPPDFLDAFGYGAATILSHAYIGTQSIIRTPGTFGGPNQLGAFMILPFCLILAASLKRWRWHYLPMLAVVGGACWLSYSRSAWIGLVAAGGVTLVTSTSWRKSAAIIGGLSVFGAIVGALAVSIFNLRDNLLNLVVHGDFATGSTGQHAAALEQGLKLAGAHPWGMGLGTAGPATLTNVNSVVPENYYLQIAIETGWLGLALFAVINALVAGKLWRARHESAIATAMLGALVGLAVANLFLHVWADSSIAFVFWILAGSLIGERIHHVHAN